VRVKIAASLDGRSAIASGQSRWITGPEARADGHAWRARACAILTGIGNVRIVTARDVNAEWPAGTRTLALPDAHGRVDLRALMHELALDGVNELHVEAGARLNGALLDA